MKVDRLRRLPTAIRALRTARELESHDAWSPERVAQLQRRRLLATIRDAAARSPFYRERFAGIELADDLDLASLPTLDKATMLGNFDDLVTDRRLTLAGVETHLAELERDSSTPPLLGKYLAMVSGGTSGRRGVFVYGPRDWNGILAGVLRWNGAYLGQRPRLPRLRLATVLAMNPLHSSGRMALGVDVGFARFLRLDARSPLSELVEALNAFRPDGLTAYASVAALLAGEQLAGRLRIAPRTIVTSSEVRTAEMEERIVAAWGRRPHDGYSTTETGVIAADCDRHAGMHVFSELVQVEVVDGAGRPARTGRVLVTNLVNRTQPLIRFELTDLATVSSRPCPCGRPYPLLESVDGRSDDVLELPATGGGTTAVHPLTIRGPLAGIAALREYQVVHDRDGLRVRAAIATEAAGGSGDVCAEIETRLREALCERGVDVPPLTVEPVSEIARHPVSGKHRLIESR